MHRTITLALPLLLLAGCSDDSTVTIEEFLQQYPEVYCKHLLYCCDGNERSYSSEVTCQNAVRDQMEELLAFREAKSTPYAEFLPDQAKSCIDSMMTRDCSDAKLIAGCHDRVTRALHKLNEECTYSAECDAFYCVQAQKNVKGYCGSQSVIGGGCSGDHRGCPLGSYCSSYRRCETTKNAGSTCSAGYECDSNVCPPTLKSCAGVSTTTLCDGV